MTSDQKGSYLSYIQIGEGIPVTYVPARNTILLSFALAWAEVLQAEDIFIGVNALDYSGYPDCRPEYIQAYQQMANLATKAGVEGKQHLRIHTPLIQLTKAQIIQKGAELGVDYGLTLSCYDPSPAGEACGQCDSCLLRKKRFCGGRRPGSCALPVQAWTGECTTNRLYYVAAAPFEAARQVNILLETKRSARLHGHSFTARVRATVPDAWGPYPVGEVETLADRVNNCIAP